MTCQKKILTKNNYFFLIILTSSLSWVSCSEIFFFDSKKKQSFELVDSTIVKNGAFILRNGNNLVSKAILFGLNESIPISHGGFIVGASTLKNHGVESDIPDDPLNDWGIIHSVSSKVSNKDGIQVCSLEEFIRHAPDSLIYVSEPKEFNIETREKVISRLIKLLKSEVSFDHEFDHYNHEEIYCSELAFLVLEEELGIVQLKNNIHKPMSESLGFAWAFDSTQFVFRQSKMRFLSHKDD